MRVPLSEKTHSANIGRSPSTSPLKSLSPVKSNTSQRRPLSPLKSTTSPLKRSLGAQEDFFVVSLSQTPSLSPVSTSPTKKQRVSPFKSDGRSPRKSSPLKKQIQQQPFVIYEDSTTSRSNIMISPSHLIPKLNKTHISSADKENLQLDEPDLYEDKENGSASNEDKIDMQQLHRRPLRDLSIVDHPGFLHNEQQKGPLSESIQLNVPLSNSMQSSDTKMVSMSSYLTPPNRKLQNYKFVSMGTCDNSKISQLAKEAATDDLFIDSRKAQSPFWIHRN